MGSGSGRKCIYNNIRVLAMFPALSVIADYTLTFVFAHGLDEILRYEFSPIVQVAAVSGHATLLMMSIAVSYFILSYLALWTLGDTCIYPFIVTILVVVSITHVMGGFSWLVRVPLYSHMVLGLSVMAFVLAVVGIIWGVCRCPQHFI